jgi:hypothetical protein
MALTRPRLGQLTTNVAAISDPITVLHSNPSQANVDVGLVFNRSNGITSNVALYWNEANNRFATVYTSDAGGSDANVTVSSYARLDTGDHNVLGNLTVTGTVTFLQSEIVAGAQVTAGNVVANSGVASTTTTSGALVVAGGVGISGSMNIGGTITTSGNVNANLNGTALYATNLVGGGTGQIPFQTGTNNTSFNSSLIFTTGNSTLSATTVSAIGLVAGATGVTTQSVTSPNSTVNLYNSGTQTQINIGTGIANVGIPGTAYVGSATSVNGYFWSNGAPYIPYANVNVATYLPVYGGALLAGNITASNVAATANVTAPNLIATSTATAGSLVTNTVSSASSTVNIYSTGSQSQINIGTGTANVGVAGTMYSGNAISVNGYFWSNGSPYIPPSTYTSSNVASFLTTYNGNVLLGNATISNSVTVSNGLSTNTFTLGPVPVLETTSTTASIGASPTAIDTFSTSAYRGAKYVVTTTDVSNSQYQVAEIIVVHDGTTPSISVYGVVNTGPTTVMTFSANIATSTVTLYGTGVSANNTVKLAKMLIPV